jgi:catechol 2,3-dioxygenase-like lactoylglutathione lyase family enzyme
MSRGLDHLVVASRDLAAQAALYESLGFRVGARNRHPWGTLNHIVQFDGCFLELIALEDGFVGPDPGAPVAQFANFLADYLNRREGFAMLVLQSRDAAADQADFVAHGIAGPSTFFFERRGERPDGTPVHVAFTLAFAASPAIPEAGFFVCQQHFPENFWNPAYQIHANGVTGVAAAVMVAEDPLRHAAFFESYTAGGQVTRIDGGITVSTSRGRIDVMQPTAVETNFGEPAPAGSGPRFAAIRFRVEDTGRILDLCRSGGIPCRKVGTRVVVPAASAFGVILSFERP